MSKTEHSIYSATNYKTLLKERLVYLRKKRPGLSWRSLADKIPLQATYLSKSLNDFKTHLSEDDLFRLCQWLELRPDEVDFILLLRAANIAQDKARKEHLAKKIQDLKTRRVVSADYVDSHVQDLTHEMGYLLDPFNILVHAALFIPKYKKDPLLICSQLGISQQKLKSSLETLHKSGYIKLGSKTYEVATVSNQSPHFGREHPLTRIHQLALKSALLSRLHQTPENNKESFFATFSMDDKGFQQAKEAFGEFIKKVQTIAQNSKDDKLYQLNFDLLEWF